MYKEAPRYYTRGAMFVKKMKEIRSQILKQVKEEYEHRGVSTVPCITHWLNGVEKPFTSSVIIFLNVHIPQLFLVQSVCNLTYNFQSSSEMRIAIPSKKQGSYSLSLPPTLYHKNAVTSAFITFFLVR